MSKGTFAEIRAEIIVAQGELEQAWVAFRKEHEVLLQNKYRVPRFRDMDSHTPPSDYDAWPKVIAAWERLEQLYAALGKEVLNVA